MLSNECGDEILHMIHQCFDLSNGQSKLIPKSYSWIRESDRKSLLAHASYITSNLVFGDMSETLAGIPDIQLRYEHISTFTKHTKAFRYLGADY